MIRYDEIDHLTAIANRMKCGHIRMSKPYNRHNANPCVRWTVTKASDLAKIVVPHFDRFPLQLKKARDFVIWRPCVILADRVTHRPNHGRRGGPKMTASERQFMADSMAELRKTRQYDSQITPIPKDHPTRDGNFPLFPVESFD